MSLHAQNIDKKAEGEWGYSLKVTQQVNDSQKQMHMGTVGLSAPLSATLWDTDLTYWIGRK